MFLQDSRTKILSRKKSSEGSKHESLVHAQESTVSDKCLNYIDLSIKASAYCPVDTIWKKRKLICQFAKDTPLHPFV